LKVEISERKQAEESLHIAQAQLTDRAGQLEGLVVERTGELTATNHQLEAFAYSVAHDLRSPLQAIKGFALLLVEQGGSTLNENCKNFAARISQSAQFMDTLLTDLLAFSRISQQRVVLASVNLETLVESVISRLQREIQEKNAQVETVGPWPDVMAHAPTLAQVLINLTSNALKFVKPGVPPIVRLWTEDRAEFVRVWVDDNGLGIAAAYKDQIFRLFSRLHGQEYSGTGVGLAIVQKGIERMGGKTGVESTLGQGSRFWFELQKARDFAEVVNVE
jgi:signal transduction histidine kinase